MSKSQHCPNAWPVVQTRAQQVQLAASDIPLRFRTAVHCSLFALYGLGGWLVQRKLLPIRVLLSAIGFTFSLVFATQGVVQTLADTRKVTSSMQRWSQSSFAYCYLVPVHTVWPWCCLESAELDDPVVFACTASFPVVHFAFACIGLFHQCCRDFNAEKSAISPRRFMVARRLCHS